MKAARVFQLTALTLVGVAVVQVGWWLIDQHQRTVEKVAQTRALYEQQLAAARALRAAGVTTERIHALLPGIVAQNSGPVARLAVAPAVLASLQSERARRIQQYAWESGFFLLALAACVTVIWRALRSETRVIEEQDSFLALVSHQFKTPLASLQLSLETMAMRELSPERARTLIDRMLADLSRMEAMVSQILDSVRLERGKVDWRAEPVALAPAVQRVVGQLGERARGEKVDIAVEVPGELSVLIDPLGLDVIVRNLLENALTAVAAAGGGRIALAARRSNGRIELAVRDTGVGFDAADRPLLFRKFARLHGKSGSGRFGTGLGLFIVRRLMELSGGRISAQSPGPGRGAEFLLAWPVAAP